ncbi:unnamed protein product, partial [Iphiclides podalirius]
MARSIHTVSAQNSATRIALWAAFNSSSRVQLVGHADHDVKCSMVGGTAPRLHPDLEPSESHRGSGDRLGRWPLQRCAGGRGGVQRVVVARRVGGAHAGGAAGGAAVRQAEGPPSTAAPPRLPNPFAHVLERIDGTAVLVRCGAAWGAGIHLGGGYVITCAHVVRQHDSYKVSLYCEGVKETAIVRYKTADDKAYDLALLYSNPEHWRHLSPALFAEEPAEKGEPVLAAGYPFFSETHLRELRPTVTSGRVTNASPSMMHTSCCVQSGFSGGPIFRLSGGRAEVLGVVVSTAKSHTGASYPYVNMAAPVRAFIRPLQNFILDKDITKLQQIESKKETIQSQWRLLPYRSKI